MGDTIEDCAINKGKVLKFYAGEALLVERLICNQEAAGSIPVTSPINVRGWSNPARRQTLNLDDVGSNPAPRTIFTPQKYIFIFFLTSVMSDDKLL